MERTERSWKKPTEVGKFLLQLESFAEVGKFWPKLESFSNIQKPQRNYFYFWDTQSTPENTLVHFSKNFKIKSKIFSLYLPDLTFDELGLKKYYLGYRDKTEDFKENLFYQMSGPENKNLYKFSVLSRN